MDKQQTTSLSYLVRLWATGAGHQQVWRASLEDAQSGERRGFANLEQLFVFLMEQTEQSGDPPDAQSTAEPAPTGSPIS
jgi:hypothetical protein